MSDTAVIIPAYESESTIDAALASVAGQTDPPSEVVVVDDGSADRTYERARRWDCILPLSVVRQSNAGPAAARRRAIEASSSPLLALLDADDLWLPDHLASMRAAHAEHGGIVTAGALRWLPGRGIGTRGHLSLHRVPAAAEQPDAILRSNFVFVGALFAREDHDLVGGFRDGFSGAEDWDLWIRMIRRGLRVTTTGTPTVIYRIKDGSLSAGSEIHETYLQVLEEAEQEADTASERAQARRSIPRYRARAELGRAHLAIGQGDLALGRSIARGVHEGPWAFRIEAVVLAVAPRFATQFGNLIRRRRWRS